MVYRTESLVRLRLLGRELPASEPGSEVGKVRIAPGVSSGECSSRKGHISGLLCWCRENDSEMRRLSAASRGRSHLVFAAVDGSFQGRIRNFRTALC